MARITISYRREDSGVITGRIFDRLVAHYGRDAVFRDIDNIPLGVDFREHINQVLDASDVVLAIVGPRWIGPRGQSRLANEADPVRVEIEAVLRKSVPLVPVLVLRGAMPRADQLPETLKDFAYRNAIQVDDAQDFDVHMSRLIRAMDRMLEPKAPQAAAFVAEPPAAIVLDRPAAEAAPQAQTEEGRAFAPAPSVESTATAVARTEPAEAVWPTVRRGVPVAVWVLLAALIGGGAGLGLEGYLRWAPQAAAPATGQDEARIEALQDELAAARQQAEQDKKRLSAALAAAQQQAAAGDKSGQLQALQSRAEAAERNLAAEKETSANARRAAKQAADDKTALQDQLAAVQKQADAAQQRLETEVKTIGDQLAAEQQAHRATQTQVEQLTDQAKELQTKLAASQKQAEPEQKKLQAQLKMLGDQLAAEQQAHRTAQAQVEQLTAQAKDSQAKVAADSSAAAKPGGPEASPAAVAPAAVAPAPAVGENSWTMDQRREIQQALRLLANYRGEADGGFGAGTRAAIKVFQSYEGDPETGTLNEAERQNLVQMGQGLASLLDQPGSSPEGVAADAVRGVEQRYARGWAAENGKGVKQDAAEAAYWYALAAAEGDGRAFANLGTLTARGRAGAAPDAASAALLWQAAAARGDAVAMFNLGVLYERGIGVGADPARAKAWYKRAADHNYPQARAALKRLGT